MTDFYDRVAAASGVKREIVRKVLAAAAFSQSNSDRVKLAEFRVVKCPCGQKGCSSHGLNVGNFFQGCGWDEPTAQEICRRVNNHYPLVRALSSYVMLGTGSNVMVSRIMNENARIALASAGEM